MPQKCDFKYLSDRSSLDCTKLKAYFQSRGLKHAWIEGKQQQKSNQK